MFSLHVVLGVKFVIEWHEKSPGVWMIKDIGLKGGQSSPNPPPALQKRITETEAVIKGWLEGVIPTLPVDLIDHDAVDLSETSRKVLDTLYREVGRGHVISYKNLGEKAGLGPHAARAVGNVMARNPWALFYPCHRVITTGGGLGNYGGGIPMKAALLKMEGAKSEKGVYKEG